MFEAIIKIILVCVLPVAIAFIVVAAYTDYRISELEQEHYDEMKKNNDLLEEVIKTNEEL